MKKHPAAVVFDMDGLLFDSEVLYRDAYLRAASGLGFVLTVENFLSLVGRSWSVNRATLQEHVGSSVNVETFRLAWMQQYEETRATLALKAGALQLLDLLDELHVPRAICTSSGHDDVGHNLRIHGLTDRFDAIIAAGDYVRGKPAPDPFIRAAEKLAVAPDTCLALEDSFNGIRAASAAGMQTVMVPDLLQPTDEIRKLCDFVALDLHEVCEWLRGDGFRALVY